MTNGIIKNPNSDQLSEIYQWLKDENLTNDWKKIVKYWGNNELMLFEFDNQIIGFITFVISGKMCNIDYFCIRNELKENGIGKVMLNKFENHFRQFGILVKIALNDYNKEIDRSEVKITKEKRTNIIIS